MAARGEITASCSLDLGVDLVSHEATVQPFSEGAALVASTNTRLNKVRGVPTKAPGAVAMTDPDTHVGQAACGGIVPFGASSSALVLRHPRYGQQRVAGTALKSLTAPGSGTLHKPWPADVPRAGAVPLLAHIGLPPAMASLSGRLWFAQVKYEGGSGRLYVTVIGASGEIEAAPQAVFTIWTGTAVGGTYWVGLTAHGVNGIRVWYRDGTATTVLMRSLTIANSTVTAGAPLTVYTPIAGGDGTYDVTAHGSTFAWLATQHSVTATQLSVTKVNVATNAVVGTGTTPANMNTNCRVAIKSEAMSAGDFVAVTQARDVHTCSLWLWDGSATPVLVHAFGGQMATGVSVGEPIAGFLRVGSSEYVMYGCCDIAGAIGTSFSDTAGTMLQFRSVDAAGTLAASPVLAWTRCIARVMHHSPGSGEIYPLLCMQTCWDSTTGATATASTFLSDPDVRIFRVDWTDTLTCVGRFGVDRAAIYPQASTPGSGAALYNAQTCCISGDKYAFTYLETANLKVARSFPYLTTRYAEMDFAARQPRVAIGANGTAIVAGAMPMEWDGVTFAECSPPVKPKVAVVSLGGTGPAVPAGNYIVSAVHMWLDAAGVLHRSAPADPLLVAAGGGSWVVQVSEPAGLVRDGSSNDRHSTVLYVSEIGQTTPVYQGGLGAAGTTRTSYTLQYSDVTLSAADADHPAIYTDGSPGLEVPSQHPGALYDVAIVNERAWGLSAERRNEWFFTKPKDDTVQNIAYEWSSEFKVTTPPSAGDGVAVVDNAGVPTLLCKRGVWVVTGPGPDVLGINGGFNTPEQVSDLGCTSRASVIKTPVGIMFIANTRFALVGSGGQRVFEQIDASGIGNVCPVLLRDTQEVVWFSSTGTHYVYNYALDRWTTWDSTVCPSVACAALDPVSGYVLIARDFFGTVLRMDPNDVSAAAQVSFSTGRVQFGGPEDDNAVNDIIIRARKAGTHGLTVTITNDYGTDNVTRTFSSADIDACVEGDHYTLCVSPQDMDMRACKLAITETDAAGEGFQPVAVTFVVGKNAGTKRDAVRPAGRA